MLVAASKFMAAYALANSDASKRPSKLRAYTKVENFAAIQCMGSARGQLSAGQIIQ